MPASDSPACLSSEPALSVRRRLRAGLARVRLAADPSDSSRPARSGSSPADRSSSCGRRDDRAAPHRANVVPIFEQVRANALRDTRRPQLERLPSAQWTCAGDTAMAVRIGEPGKFASRETQTATATRSPPEEPCVSRQTASRAESVVADVRRAESATTSARQEGGTCHVAGTSAARLNRWPPRRAGTEPRR